MSDGGWKKASNNAPAWEPEKDKIIEGVLKDYKQDVGKFGSTLCTVETKDGPRAVWCNKMLADLMSIVPIGSEVKVEFLGMAEAKSGTGEYKTYEVNYREAPMKKVESPEQAF